MDNTKKQQKKNSYGAENITVLEGLEPVRKRPGMYIGSTSSTGLHHLIWEVVDNGIDEAMAGHANEVSVTLLPGNMVQISDNGRGIPVEKHKSTGLSALETVLTKLHAGGKFGEGGGYKVSGGLHGVGVSVVNALSTYLKAEIHRDGKIWEQEYSIGKSKGKPKATGKTKKTGTTITFKADDTIFSETEYDWGKILDRLRQQSYLTKGVTIIAKDKREGHREKEYKFYFEGGIKSYVKSLHRTKNPKHKSIFYFEKDIEDAKVEIALQYNDEYNENVLSFANNIHNPEGGTHLSGFKTALTRTLNSYARNQKILKEKEENLTGEDVREGLTAIISVKLTNPQFEGQTKGKLGNAEIKTYVEQSFGEAFSIFLGEHPKESEAIIGKCIVSAQARLAARTARATILRKGALEGMTLPGKLADCSSRKPEESELYIVEGDSAGGCFSGDTEVALADGRSLSFLELIKENKEGKQNYCYTMNNNGDVAIEKILNPRLTKKNANVIKITLDNNEEIICTPDHKFRLANDTYVEAQNLDSEMSLAPLYRKISKREKRITIDGYEMVWQPKLMKWVFTHMLANDYNLNNKKYHKELNTHKHHIDFNKLNNNPDNIVEISKKDHMSLHAEMAEKTILREDVKEKCRKIRKTLEYRTKVSKTMLKMKEELSRRAKKQWENTEYKEYMKEKYLEFYNSNANYRLKNNKILDDSQKEYWSKAENRKKQSLKVKNFFVQNPECKTILSEKAVQQWKDEKLREWRSKKTQTQWTEEFRNKRRKTYNETYYRNTISCMKKVFDKYGSLDNYDEERTQKRNSNLLKEDTFVNRFFSGDKAKMLETVEHYNHKIKKIEKLEAKMDVYDIEVPKSHNFALANGVFVHNSAKQGRNRRFQAILPLRGKILNVERARMDKMLNNNEIKSLVIALGANIDEQFDLEKLRYHRIIIMTDADVDGAHIRTLLLTLFFRHFNPLITNGNLYIAQPPLYQIKKGSKIRYAYTEADKVEIIKDLGGDIDEEEIEKAAIEESDSDGAVIKVKGQKIVLQRYKGLGEMNPDQLWETTMDPENRILKQVTVEDAAKADQIFDMLMGGDVAPRKHFIQTHAKKVENLDV
jgi:DNA gyrase subunit B